MHDSTVVRASLHAEAGHLPVGIRARLVDAVLDQEETRAGRRLEATVPLGDIEALERLRARCAGRADPAGRLQLPRRRDPPPPRLTSPPRPALPPERLPHPVRPPDRGPPGWRAARSTTTVGDVASSPSPNCPCADAPGPRLPPTTRATPLGEWRLRCDDSCKHFAGRRPGRGCSVGAGLDFLWLELTNRCNLRCVHCYTESAHRPATGTC